MSHGAAWTLLGGGGETHVYDEGICLLLVQSAPGHSRASIACMHVLLLSQALDYSVA